MVLRRGFKADSERQSLALRNELGLLPTAPMHASALAQHLDIPVWTVSDLVQDMPSAAVLLTSASEAVSAMTVFDGARRVVVVNDSHTDARQNSSVAHELSHGLLLHPPQVAVDHRGLRHWQGDLEEEADWLSGALLLPHKAAWRAERLGVDDATVMARYGLSEQMLRWRHNACGITGRRRKLAVTT